jgi:site-specific recombinase XerD
MTARTRRGNRESTIAEKPNRHGYYEAKVWMGTKPDGRPDRRHIERKSLAAVRRRVRELERQRDAGLATKPGKTPTIEEMLTRHLDLVLPQRGRSPKTLDSYRSLCRNDIFPRWGGQRIDRLLPEHIEDGYAAMLKAGRAAATVRKVHAILSSAYEIGVKRGKVARNPCKLVEAPRLGQAGKTALSAEQARSVVAQAHDVRNGASWSVGLACGLRQGEALGLRWSFVDLDSGTLRVWYQLQRLNWRHGCVDIAKCTEGKHRRPCPTKCLKAERASGRRHTCIPADAPRLCPPMCAGHASTCPKRKGGGLVFREIKERRHKTVRLAPELTAIMRAHRVEQARERLAAANMWEDHDLVFCQSDGRPIDPRADWQEWSDILRHAGLPHLGVHAMRHSAATIALDEGVALAVVQEMLGHSDIRVTRAYTHVSSPLAEDAARRMGKALFGPTVPKTVPRSS